MPGRTKRVLLTGSEGFTGRHLRRELEAAGYEVVGLTNEPPVGPGDHFADLTDAARAREVVLEVAPTHVVHLAAISFVQHGRVEDIYASNVIGALNLLRALAELVPRPRRVVLASSANIYGNAGGASLDETTPPVPVNHYAASKVAMEAVASVFRPQLPIVLTRPFNYTGPGQAGHFLVPKIVAHFVRREARVELGNLDVERDFLDVRTVALLYRRLLECDRADGQVVNLCSGHGIVLRSIVTRLEELTGHRIEVVVNPQFVRDNEIARLVGSNERLRGLVGPWPEIAFETTLRDMVGG